MWDGSIPTKHYKTILGGLAKLRLLQGTRVLTRPISPSYINIAKTCIEMQFGTQRSTSNWCLLLICLLSIWISWNWFNYYSSQIDSQTNPIVFTKNYLSSFNLPQVSLTFCSVPCRPGDTRRARHAKRDSEATGQISSGVHREKC